MEEIKECIECKEIKVRSKFERWKKTRTGKYYFRTYCKECQLKKLLKRLKGKVNGQYDIRNSRQVEYSKKATRPRPDCCEACGGPPTGGFSALSYDHDHIT